MNDAATREDVEKYWFQISRTPDGKIDKGDDVYEKLLLWKDMNRDGMTDAGELMTLKEAGLKSIDLNYDPNFKEEDQYGNIIQYKSVAQMDSGQLNLVFDIWFKAPR